MNNLTHDTMSASNVQQKGLPAVDRAFFCQGLIPAGLTPLVLAQLLKCFTCQWVICAENHYCVKINFTRWTTREKHICLLSFHLQWNYQAVHIWNYT